MTPALPALRTLLLETDGAIATVTLNRADALNAIDVAMARDLQQAAQWLEARDDVRVVLLRAAGKAFCAGGDISMFEGEPAHVRATLLDLFTPLNDFVARVARMDKLWLAQVHGIAAGAGLSLVLACDLAIAAADARFLTAYLKLGATPDAGMTHGLTRVLGARRALDLLLRPDPFGAAEALAWASSPAPRPPGIWPKRRGPTPAPWPRTPRTASPAPRRCCALPSTPRWKPSWPKRPRGSWTRPRAPISPKACRPSARNGRRHSAADKA